MNVNSPDYPGRSKEALSGIFDGMVKEDWAKKDRLLAAARKMENYGGGFASAIGTAWIRADAGNKAKLEAAFPELFERYASMGGE